ncbi:MAG: nucleotidyltransferase family protein [bacterium]
MKPSLLVLAAGMGSRYGGLKQMEPLGPAGETLLDYTLHDAARAGFGRVVFVIRRDFAEAFQAGPGARAGRLLAVDYAYQALDDVPTWFHKPEGRTKPWGTGHAVLAAREALREPFAVVNADDFYGRQGFEILARALAAAADGIRPRWFLVGYPLGRTLSAHGTVSRGVCSVDTQGRLLGVQEYIKIERLPSGGGGARDQDTGRIFNGTETVSLNFFGFTPDLFASLERGFEAFLKQDSPALATAEFFAPAALDALIQSGQAEVRVLASDGAWFGVTYREDRAKVAHELASLVSQGEYPQKLPGFE